MAKKPLRIYRANGGALGPVQAAPIPGARRAVPVYKDGNNNDRLSITQEVREHPEVHRARTREALHSKYDELFHSIYDAVVITDLTGSIKEANARAEHTFMWNRDDLCRMRVVDLISGADEELLKVVRQNVNNKKYTILEAVCLRENGSRFYAEIVVNRLRSDDQRALCFFVRDISTRKQAENELGKANEQLVQAEKIQARLDTISTLWYEFNNPLQILTCMAELDQNKEYKKQLGRIVAVLDKLRNQESLEAIVDDSGESRYPVEGGQDTIEEKDCHADRMLVVDDEAVLRDIFVAAIRTEVPYMTVDAASNGTEAFELFKKSHHGLIIMDISMPVTTGEEAFELIRAYCAENHLKIPRVIFCTGFVIGDNLKAIIGDGSYHGCLRKPLTMTDLLEAVKKSLAEQPHKQP